MIIKEESKRNGEVGNPSYYRNLTSFEVDVFNLIYAKKEKKERLVILSFDELRKKGGFSEKEYSNDQFAHKLVDLSIKLAGLVFYVTGDDEPDVITPTFTFAVDRKKQRIVVKKITMFHEKELWEL